MLIRCRGVFFDLYGTLLQYRDPRLAWGRWLEVIQQELTDLGGHVEERDLAGLCDRFFGRDEPHGGPEEATVFERRLAALLTDCRLPVPSVGRLRRVADRAAAAWQEHVPLDPEAPRLLERLSRDFVLGLVTNFDHPPHVRRILEELGIGKRFAVVAISGEIGVKKPGPAIFQKALGAVGLDASEVVHVGDTDADVLGARAAGMAPVFLDRNASDADLDFRADASGAEPQTAVGSRCLRTIRSLSELPGHLAAVGA